MRHKKLFLVFLTVVSLSGCSTLKGIKGAQWPWSQANPCASTCTEQEAMQAFVAASGFCRDVQNYYESGGFYAKSSRLAVGTIGALAGSVMAPLATGSATNAWAGLSGATNALQSQMDEAFSSAVAVRRRAAIVEAAEENAARYRAAVTPSQRVVAAIDMARSCSMGSATADQGTLRALSVPTSIKPSTLDSPPAGPPAQNPVQGPESQPVP